MSAPHQVLASPASRLCVPLDEWPEHDRRRWLEAQQPAVRRRSIHDPVPADRGRRRHNPKDRWPARRSQQRRTSLSPQRLRDLERAYGLWLRYLADHGGFDAAAGPAGAVTDDHVDGFVSWLQAGGKPATVHTYLQRFLLALRILAPRGDWSALASLVRRLTPPPPDPTRRLADVRHPAEFLALAEHLMDEAEKAAGAGRKHEAAILYRDGLILAFLVFAALRRASLLHLAFGTTLRPTDEGYLIVLGPEHTKGRRGETIPLHSTLTTWIKRYLDCHRRVLLKGRETPALWIAQDGKPLQAQGVWYAVGRHTAAHLGVRINPHFIRHCIATTTAVEHPEAIDRLPAVLQHRDFRVTERHYILATQLQARMKYQDALDAERNNLQDLESSPPEEVY